MHSLKQVNNAIQHLHAFANNMDAVTMLFANSLMHWLYRQFIAHDPGGQMVFPFIGLFIQLTNIIRGTLTLCLQLPCCQLQSAEQTFLISGGC